MKFCVYILSLLRSIDWTLCNTNTEIRTFRRI